MIIPEIVDIYKGKVQSICVDGNKLYILNSKLICIDRYKGTVIEEKEIIATDFYVLDAILYTYNDSILYRDGIEVIKCSIYHIKSNNLKQHIVYAYDNGIVHRITINQSMSIVKEQFGINLIEFTVVENELLLIMTPKHVGFYLYGKEDCIGVVHESKLDLPFIGASKYKYILDSSHYLYLARYKGVCIFENQIKIQSHYLPLYASGMIQGGFLYTVEDNCIKIVHLYTLETTTYQMTGKLLKTSQGMYLYANNCLYQIKLMGLESIHSQLCLNNLFLMALESLKSNLPLLVYKDHEREINYRYIKYLIHTNQLDHSCQLMMDCAYPLQLFLQQFPEIIPDGLDVSELHLDTIESNKTMNMHTVRPFLPFLSSKRLDYDCIDTILFFIYSKLNPNLLESLVRVENTCHLEICGKILLDLKLYSIWINFYFSKQAHQQAFDKLKTNTLSVHYWNDYFELLLNDNKLELVLNQIQLYFELFKDISFFVCHSQLQSNAVQQQIILTLDFNKELQRDYLKDVVFTQQAQFQSTLLQSQLTIIKDKITLFSIEDDIVMKERLLFREFLTKLNQYNGIDLIDPLLELKLEFECALVYKSLDKHKEALELYLINMNNPVEAEKYCFDAFNNDHLSVFTTLFSLLKHHNKDTTAFILEYIPYLDPLLVFQDIKNEKLSVVVDLIKESINKYKREYQEKCLLLNQLKIQHSSLRQELYYEQSQKCLIDAYKVCFNCNRRIGDKACYMYDHRVCCINCITSK